jgi:hypothetical protein
MKRPRPALLESGLVFAVLSIIYIASPTWNASDSHFMLPTAESLIRHGDASIDGYRDRFREASWAVIHQRGHDWNLYPIGTPLMVLPAVWLWDRVEALQGHDLEALLQHNYPFFAEEVLASLITALAAALLFWYSRDRLTLPRAVLLTALFAFGTSAYSTASRGLLQHGPSMLLIMLSIVVYSLPDSSRWTGLPLGIIAGFSWVVRPSNLLLVIGFALLCALERRSHLAAYVCGSILGVVPMFWYNLSAFGTWSSYYDFLLRSSVAQTTFHLEPIVGTLISPSRGLFVFCPFLLWLAVRSLKYFRIRHRFSKLELMLAATSIIWWAGVTRLQNWWGGGSYGPRLLCELMLCGVVLLIPVVQELSLTESSLTRLMTAGFVLAGALGVGIHLRGAVSQSTVLWIQRPINLDKAPGRLWDWHDPQFLRGMGR